MDLDLHPTSSSRTYDDDGRGNAGLVHQAWLNYLAQLRSRPPCKTMNPGSCCFTAQIVYINPPHTRGKNAGMSVDHQFS